MPTVLENYTAIQEKVSGEIANGHITPDAVWWYSELSYRIEVLKTCQMYCRTAPITKDVNTLLGHYRMLDAYVQCLAQERRYGPNRGPDTQKERDAAQINLGRVIQDYRNRFTSFTPTDQNTYSNAIGKLLNTLLPAWLQFRNTFVPIKKVKKEDNAQ